MKILWYIAIGVALVALVRACVLVRNWLQIRDGYKDDMGSFTLVTRNVSYLYYQAKIVYPKLPEIKRRFIALFINSASIRNRFSAEDIIDLVIETAKWPWSEVCARYTWQYAENIGGMERRFVQSLDSDSIAAEHAFTAIATSVQWVQSRVESGHYNRFAERTLRTIPRNSLIMLLTSFDMEAERRAKFAPDTTSE